MRFSLLFTLLIASEAMAQVKVEEDTVPIIHSVPVAGRLLAVDQTQHLNGPEFDLLVLTGATGEISWDVYSPNSASLPVKIVELKPKSIVVGYRVGHTVPGPHVSPDAPSVAVFAVGSGKAIVAAWGVKDGKAVKIATMQIDANLGPRPPPVDPTPKPPEPTPVDPTPQPVPPAPTPVPPPVTASVVTVIVIEDHLKRTPASAALVADLTYWRGLEPIVENMYDIPSKSEHAAMYAKQIADAGGVLPVVIVMDFKTKKVLASEKLPADKVGMSALINRLTGKQ